MHEFTFTYKSNSVTAVYEQIQPEMLIEFLDQLQLDCISKKDFRSLVAVMPKVEYDKAMLYICQNARFNKKIDDFFRPDINISECLKVIITKNIQLLVDMPATWLEEVKTYLKSSEFMSGMKFTRHQLEMLVAVEPELAVEENSYAYTYLKYLKAHPSNYKITMGDGESATANSVVEYYQAGNVAKNNIKFFNKIKSVIDLVPESHIRDLSYIMEDGKYFHALEYVSSQSWFNRHLSAFVKPELNAETNMHSSDGAPLKEKLVASIIKSIAIFNPSAFGYLPDSLLHMMATYFEDFEFLKTNAAKFREPIILEILNSGVVDKRDFLTNLLAIGNNVRPMLEKELLLEIIDAKKSTNVHKI